ncbi:hypothetical protein PVAP13_6NG237700 [Panicum virgatum]|uniref:Uncharacterized protein n=1 Tax=Panicum virgatum TaxID=38727 RepID=A0A8T0R1D6_PANVG|nr:hypothetical protein PVAP13_6NG237700 [Panicum virgatum]
MCGASGGHRFQSQQKVRGADGDGRGNGVLGAPALTRQPIQVPESPATLDRPTQRPNQPGREGTHEKTPAQPLRDRHGNWHLASGKCNLVSQSVSHLSLRAAAAQRRSGAADGGESAAGGPGEGERRAAPRRAGHSWPWVRGSSSAPSHTSPARRGVSPPATGPIAACGLRIGRSPPGAVVIVSPVSRLVCDV